MIRYKYFAKTNDQQESWESGLCIPQSCTLAICISENHLQSNLFDCYWGPLYNYCDMINDFLNDTLISWFPYTLYNTYAVWSDDLTPQFLDYINLAHKKITRDDYIQRHNRM